MHSPKNDDAPNPCQDRGAGNVIPFRLYPKDTTRKPTPTTMTAPQRVRLFLGNDATIKATEWASMHGRGSAIALPDGRDPVDMEWPVGALIKVVEERPEPLGRLSALALAMRQAGVAYAALPHQPDWPNLWPACGPGGVA